MVPRLILENGILQLKIYGLLDSNGTLHNVVLLVGFDKTRATQY